MSRVSEMNHDVFHVIKKEGRVSDKRTVSQFPAAEYRSQKYSLQDQVLMMPENQRIKNTSKDNLQYICYRREQQHSLLMVKVREGSKKRANGEKEENRCQTLTVTVQQQPGLLIQRSVDDDGDGGCDDLLRRHPLCNRETNTSVLGLESRVCIDGNKKTKGKAVGEKVGGKISLLVSASLKPVSKLHITVWWTCFFRYMFMALVLNYPFLSKSALSNKSLKNLS